MTKQPGFFLGDSDAPVLVASTAPCRALCVPIIQTITTVDPTPNSSNSSRCWRLVWQAMVNEMTCFMLLLQQQAGLRISLTSPKRSWNMLQVSTKATLQRSDMKRPLSWRLQLLSQTFLYPFPSFLGGALDWIWLKGMFFKWMTIWPQAPDSVVTKLHKITYIR